MASRQSPRVCRATTLTEALSAFVRAAAGTQGQEHIAPLHWYVACRLCLEGGFDPDCITPRPLRRPWHEQSPVAANWPYAEYELRLGLEQDTVDEISDAGAEASSPASNADQE